MLLFSNCTPILLLCNVYCVFILYYVAVPYLVSRGKTVLCVFYQCASADAELCELRESFESLQSFVRKGVEKSKKGVEFLVKKIMSLPAPLRDESDEEYLNKRTDDIIASKSVSAVFFRIGFNWDYLNPDIYYYLIKTYNLEGINEMIKEYQKRFDRFIDCTTLEKFCTVEGKKCPSKPPREFEEHVTKHDWKPTTPLRKVIEFREECTNQYCLRKCAVWLVGMGVGCVFITFLVPKGIKTETTGIEFYEKHAILRLELNGRCIYEKARIIMVA